MPGRVGRKKKPTALRLIQGNQEHRPLPEGEPELEALTGDVVVPDWLSSGAAVFWDSFVAELQEMGVLTAVDVPALAMLCEAYAEAAACSAVIAEGSRTYEAETASGATMVRKRPEVAMRADADRRVRAWMAEFGMTPSSRTRVTPSKPPDKIDPLAKYLPGGGDGP